MLTPRMPAYKRMPPCRCMHPAPAGVHKEGLKRRFQVVDGKITFDAPAPTYEMDKFIPLECKAGTLVLLQVTIRRAAGWLA